MRDPESMIREKEENQDNVIARTPKKESVPRRVGPSAAERSYKMWTEERSLD